MRRPTVRRTRRPDLPVAAGERVLAWAEAEDGTLVAGTRDALYARTGDEPPHRLPWDQVESADWDRDASVLRVSEVGSWGQQRVSYSWTVQEPGRLLELLRERVTATVLFQRHVAVRGRLGVRVIARRATSGERAITWLHEYDEGLDPSDPAVAEAAAEALAHARDLVGDR